MPSRVGWAAVTADPLAPLLDLAGRRRSGRTCARRARQGAPAPGQSAWLAGDGRRGGAACGPRFVGARRRSVATRRGVRPATRCSPERCGSRRHSRAVRPPWSVSGSGRRLQALARLHCWLLPIVCAEDQLGRPRSDPEVSARLDLMSRLVTGASSVPAPILAAVAHGEVLALSAFGSADGVVARGVSPVGSDRHRTRPARAGCAGGVLVAPGRGLPKRGAGVRLGIRGRRGALAGVQLPCATGRGAGSALDRRGEGSGGRETAPRVTRWAGAHTARNTKRAAFRMRFGSPPASTDSRLPSVQRGLCGMASAWFAVRFDCRPHPRGRCCHSRFRNHAGPQHFCHYRGCGSAWVPGSVLGSLGREVEPFSSESTLALPGFRVFLCTP